MNLPQHFYNIGSKINMSYFHKLFTKDGNCDSFEKERLSSEEFWAGFFVAHGVNVINLFTSFCPCIAFTALSNV